MVAKTKKQFTELVSDIKNPILGIIQRDKSGRDFYIKSDDDKERWFRLPGCRRMFLQDTKATYENREKKLTLKYIGWMKELDGKDFKIVWL